MRPAFDQWLGKPSTICFLRRLLATHDPPSPTVRQRRHLRSFNSKSFHSRPEISVAFQVEESESDRDQNIHTTAGENEYTKASNQRGQLLNTTGISKDIESTSATNGHLQFLETSSGQLQPFAQSRWQADVDADDGDEMCTPKRLVDNPKFSHDVKLWIEILHFRQRLDGVIGVYQVWRGMRKRGIDLPTSGKDADTLWPMFFRAGLSTLDAASEGRGDLLARVLDYAMLLKETTGQYYKPAYQCIMRRSFQKGGWNYADMRRWHRHLEDAGLCSDDAIPSLIDDALIALPFNPRALQIWEKLYLMAKRKDLYDVCIRRVLNVSTEVKALRVHRILIRAGDLPSAEMSKTPAVQRMLVLHGGKSSKVRRIAADDTNFTPFSQTFVGSNISELNASAPTKFTPFGLTSVNTVIGEAHGIQPKTLSDHFCARLFATTAFPISFVAKGLAAFGVSQLGPLALQVIATRAESPGQFRKRLGEIDDAGIGTGDDAYSQVVLTVSDEATSSLWDALLGLDPQVFHDKQSLEAFFRLSIAKHTWSEAHIALLALGGSTESGNAWNLLLEQYTEQRDVGLVLSTVQYMQSQSISVGKRSLDLMFEHLLAPRTPGQRPSRQEENNFHSLEFCRNTMMYAAEHGTEMHWRKWKEILKRIGMGDRWEDVERLVLWLVDHYWLKDRLSLRKLPRTHHLYLILGAQMQVALFVWAFRAAGHQHLLKMPDTDALESERQCEAWAKGLALLHRLHEQGFQIDLKKVRRALITRMWILFGPAYSTRGVNNEMRRTNRLTLEHYISHANQVWPGFVNWVDASLLSNRFERKEVMRQFYGASQRVSLQRNEYVNIDAWTNSLSHGDAIREPRSIMARRRSWETSGLRMQAAQPQIRSVVPQNNHQTSLNHRVRQLHAAR